ncbi:MAG: HNH endonuclease [Cyanobium sp.]|nr:HNH endonuclease [Cyanobium sp.]
MTPEHWDEYVSSLECLTASAARRRFRHAIKEAWHHRCAYCGAHEPQSLTLDHIRPRARGGETLRSNLVPSCCRCNRAKGSEEWRQWFRRQEFYCQVRETWILCWAEVRRLDLGQAWQLEPVPVSSQS